MPVDLRIQVEVDGALLDARVRGSHSRGLQSDQVHGLEQHPDRGVSCGDLRPPRNMHPPVRSTPFTTAVMSNGVLPTSAGATTSPTVAWTFSSRIFSGGWLTAASNSSTTRRRDLAAGSQGLHNLVSKNPNRDPKRDHATTGQQDHQDECHAPPPHPGSAPDQDQALCS